MAKTYYSIPASLERSFLDHEIVFSGGGMNLRPSPIKQLFFFGGGFLLLGWLVSSSPLSGAGLGAKAALVVWGLIVIVYLGRMTATKELRVFTVPSLLTYVTPGARKVMTRRTSEAAAFAGIVGIESIEDSGLIHFSDATVGRTYLVVGSASYLLFEADRVAILDRVDSFWRSIEPGVEVIFMTTKEPQRIYHQVAAMERRNLDLATPDPELAELLHEQYEVMTEYVGGKFTSIQQYLVLKANNPEALRRAHRTLDAEVASSSLMIREAVALNAEETTAVLSRLYRAESPLELSGP